METAQATSVETIVQRYGQDVGFLIPILQDVQKERGYLPLADLKQVARELKIPLSQVYNVVTFYKSMTLKPRGRHVITVCTGTVCHLKGAGKLIQAVGNEFKVPLGGTSEDMRFTLEGVNCVGACALAPVLIVDGKYYAKAKPDEVGKILRSYK